MSQPIVSIIVPVYNVEKYIERCVTSLTNQTIKNIEIILVDDSSTDSSLSLCEEFAKKDNRIKVIHKQNEGAGRARNAALKVAAGKYIGFVDSDDFVAHDMFEILYDKAEKYNSDLVLSGVLFVDGNIFSKSGECIRKDYFEKDTHFETDDELKELRMGIVGAEPQNADDSKYGMSIWKNLFRHEIIKENGLYFESEREIFSEDALFMIDYIAHIKKATGINEAFYNYCRNGESISKSYKRDRFEKSLIFIKEVEKRFKKDIAEKDYEPYINRFWQAMCRVLCSQEIMFSQNNNLTARELKIRLKNICRNGLTVKVLNSYPIKKLPIKQMAFAFCMKYRLYFMMKLLVKLRSKW